MADVFEKPDDLVESLQPVSDFILLLPHDQRPLCSTEDGKELTRLHRRLRIRRRRIRHPHGQASGITEAFLATATTTIARVQSHLLTLLAPHVAPRRSSPESNLKALRICHPLSIDAAPMYNHPHDRPLKPALAWLTKKWCRREIQTRGWGGHDPEEDTRACANLFRLKIQNGAGFGEFKTDLDLRASLSAWRGQATTTIRCRSGQEVLDALIQALPAHEVLFGRFTDLADAMGCDGDAGRGGSADIARNARRCTSDVGHAPRGPVRVSPGPHSVGDLYAPLGSAPDGLSQYTQGGEFELAIKNGEKADMYTAEWWTASDGREEVEKAKRGLLFLGIK
ncbi:hypothetical protein OG21DRAFT_1491303 [Imleria badia]|nr:hypothetical protein OG21DRAFT_1491303 [Imleria badia]